MPTNLKKKTSLFFKFMNVEDFLKILKPTDMLISLLIISKPSGRKIKEANKNQEGSPDISNTWKS